MIGATLPVFIGLTVVLMGGAGYLMGQALARGWRPIWQVAGYGLLLGYAIDTAVIVALAMVGYRITLAARMVAQYPWLYRRAGPMNWREKTE